MALGSLESLRAKTARRYREIEAGGETWRIQSLTASEWIEFSSRKDGTAVDIIAFCLVDADGNRLIESDDTAWLAELDSDVSHPLIEACWEHAAISTTGVKDTAKNSEATGLDISA